MLRVGNEPSGSNEAGVFYNTITAESTSASHGAATEYCGRVFLVYYGVSDTIYTISTGRGTSESRDGNYHLDPECLGFSNNIHRAAHCHDYNQSGYCPKGWGTYNQYASFKPGCYRGSYYPNPTPASDTSIYTGSPALTANVSLLLDQLL